MREELLSLLWLALHRPQKWCAIQNTGDGPAPIAVVPTIEDVDDGQHIGDGFHLHVQPVLAAVRGRA